MEKKKLNKYDKAYLRIASEWGQLSYCKRRQVGAIIVRDKMIISDGYNGTPSGFENCCEDEEGLTQWFVLHAEANAILKVARSTQTCDGATLYVTLSPCKECSKLIHQPNELHERVPFFCGSSNMVNKAEEFMMLAKLSKY